MYGWAYTETKPRRLKKKLLKEEVKEFSKGFEDVIPIIRNNEVDLPLQSSERLEKKVWKYRSRN